jgi:hypothetical protein
MDELRSIVERNSAIAARQAIGAGQGADRGERN